MPGCEVSCTNCRHAFIQDVGHSVYTVEAQVFGCLELNNPYISRSGTSWESYEDHSGKPYNFAQSCGSYREGKPQKYDVDDKLPIRQWDDW